eukprot:TRINITY_DN27959_c0_g1_i1.p2 TRINITY_DN27959_c0_g1~~TRINITY_DN27959_c0_g1_i1.p2  ORF type:complete len:123 (-),score=33.33 TRINITY_DN27959_c0_g1_i1:380-748(-)
MASFISGHLTTYEVKKLGDGNRAICRGDKVTVHCTGIILRTGRKFWSSKDPGQRSFSYTAGAGNVIKGWDVGCMGMKIGEHREITIPAKEAYGEQGFPAWGIISGDTISFYLECLDIETPQG